MVPILSVELLIGAVALIFAYLFSVTLIGTTHALVAQWAGDDTAASLGMLSFHPYWYIDGFGLACTIVFGFGWGKLLPFIPTNVRAPYKSLRVLLVYLTQPITAIVLAVTALTLNIFLIGPQSLCFAFNYILLDSFIRGISTYQLSMISAGASSATLVTAIILIAITSLNIFLATWSLVHNAFYHVLYLGAQNGYNYMQYSELILIIGPLTIFVFFSPLLRIMLMRGMAIMAYSIASYCGVI